MNNKVYKIKYNVLHFFNKVIPTYILQIIQLTDALTFHGLATVCKQRNMQKQKHRLLFTSVIISQESIYQRCLVGKHIKQTCFTNGQNNQPGSSCLSHTYREYKVTGPSTVYDSDISKACFCFFGESQQTEYTDFIN